MRRTLTLVKKQGTEGVLRRQSLILQEVPRKFHPGWWGVFETKSPIKEILHLREMGLTQASAEGSHWKSVERENGVVGNS